MLNAGGDILFIKALMVAGFLPRISFVHKFLYLLGLGLFASTVQAGPSINIGTIYDYMASDKSSYLKRINNVGDSTAFVRVNIYEMTFDADGKATETALDNQGPLSAERKGLVASPARLIIPGKGMQGTRLLYLGNRDVERYYRVRFVPVVPEKEDQFAVPEEERKAYKNSMSAGVNILTGYGSVFFVRPENTRFTTRVHNSAIEYRVENAGNSTIELDGFKDCSMSQATDCKATRKIHLRPGKYFAFSKEPGRTYSYNLIEGGASKKVDVKP